MINLFGIPSDGVDEPITCGDPWHGLFSLNDLNGLPLPNGGLKIFPKYRTNSRTMEDDPCPTNLSGHRPGDVSIVRVPGNTYSPHNSADDAAQGMQWFDYAVISGRDRYLYGSKLGPHSWLYCVKPGEVYLIEAAAYPVNSTWTLAISQFGSFLPDADGSVHYITVPFPSPSILHINEERYDTMALEMCGHSQDGSILCFGFTFGSGSESAYDRNCMYPEAFIKVQVSGSGSKEHVTVQATTYLNKVDCIQWELIHDQEKIDTTTGVTKWPIANCSYSFMEQSGISPQYKRTLSFDYADTTGPFPSILNPYTNTYVPSTLIWTGSGSTMMYGKISYLTEATSDRVMWVMVDELGGFHPVKVNIRYTKEQLVVRYEGQSYSTSGSAVDFDYYPFNAPDGSGTWTAGSLARNPSSAKLQTSFNMFSGYETRLTMSVSVGSSSSTWEAFSKIGSVDKVNTTYNMGIASMNLGVWTQNQSDVEGGTTTTPDRTDTVGGKAVNSLSIPDKTRPTSFGAPMGNAPNYFCIDGDGNTYWPYVTLVSNNLVGLVEGTSPDKVVEPYGPYYFAFLITGPDGWAKCDALLSYKGSYPGGYSHPNRFASLQPVTHEYSGLKELSGGLLVVLLLA